jgi:putative SOS response-associated peptidase YedK
MCGRYTLIGPARIRSAFPQYHFEEFSEYRLPRFNIAPTQDVLAVCNDGTNEVRALHWGMGERINARAETLLRRSIPWRCAIFADGFYEWRERKPYYFTLEDNELFAFAGVYEPGGGCTIVTVPANRLVAETHNRMPVILSAEAQTAWLEPGDIDEQRASEVLVPLPSAAMRVRSASMRLNSARYDAPDVLIDDDPVQTSMFEAD